MAQVAAEFVELDSAWEKGPKKFLDEVLEKLRTSDPSIHLKIREDGVVADIGKIFQGAKDSFNDKGVFNQGAYSVMLSILSIADEMMSSATPGPIFSLSLSLSLSLFQFVLTELADDG